jgi:hypothetical protein
LSGSYGDITPQTDGGRIFMIFYMLGSTVIVGGALSEVIDIYVNDFVGEKIIRTIINSTTWVHSADVANIGVITEADYVLFKLQQMQKVDAEMLDVLIDRFEEIDENANGWLDIGIDVPSAEQVRLMKEELKENATGKNIIKLWKEKQKTMESVIKAKKEGKKTRALKALNESLNPDAVYTEKLNIEKERIEIRKSRDFGHDVTLSRANSADFGPQIVVNKDENGDNENNNKKDNSNDKPPSSNHHGSFNNGFGLFSQLSVVAEGTAKYIGNNFSKALGTSLDDATVSEESRSSSAEYEATDDTKPLSPNRKFKKSRSSSLQPPSEGSGSDSHPSTPSNLSSSTSTASSSRPGSVTSSAPNSTASLYASRYDNSEVTHSDSLSPKTSPPAASVAAAVATRKLSSGGGGDEDDNDGGAADMEGGTSGGGRGRGSDYGDRVASSGSAKSKSPKPRSTSNKATPKVKSNPPIRPRLNSSAKEGVEMV